MKQLKIPVRLTLLIPVIFLFALLPLFSGGYRKQAPSFAEKQPDTLTFLFFSDTQADPETGDYYSLGEMLSRAVTQDQHTALVIFGGDTVNDGKDAAEWRDFWQAAKVPLTGLITAAVPGNHDSHALLAEQFCYPLKAPAKQEEGFFYSLDHGPVHFIMLDSNIMGAANSADAKWLQNDLQSEEARQAVWRIAVMHHPLWPLTENPKDTRRAETMREYFLPLLEAGGVDLILCGHQHIYGRSLPMRGESPAESGGIIQIMAASGAKVSYVTGGNDHVAVSSPAPNYLLLQADEQKLTVTACNEHHEAFDTCTLTR